MYTAVIRAHESGITQLVRCPDVGLIFEAIFRPTSGQKVNPILKGSWRLPGAVLGAFSAVLGLSWEPWFSQNACKKHIETDVFKIEFFPSSYLSWAAFGGNLGVSRGVLGSKWVPIFSKS